MLETKRNPPLTRKVLVCDTCQSRHTLPPDYSPDRTYLCTCCGLLSRMAVRLEVRELKD